ncbi:MAG: hypothetical protein J1F29_02375 [Lentimicrobiaceae bacterium]|nr:hypothetical protein [Lentimicrobiaceae bacterium]
MTHIKKEEGRKYLCLVNNIIDHLCSYKQEGVVYHTIHIPDVPQWGRELLVRFVLHKVALTFSQTRLKSLYSEITPQFTIGSNISGKSRKFQQLRAEREWLKQIKERFSQYVIPEFDNKYLFIVKEEDVINRKEDRNLWLEKLYTNEFDNSKYNVILRSDLTGYSIEEYARQMRQSGEAIPQITDVCIFHSRNRYSILNSYNISQVERLNKYGFGINRVFVFYFDKTPLRLYQTISIKHRIASALLHKEIKRFDEYNGFITFTPQETDYLFDRVNLQKHFIVDSNEREVFTYPVEDYLSQLPRGYRYKNALAIAGTPELLKIVFSNLEQQGIPFPDFSDYQNYYLKIWDEMIIQKINKFIGDDKDIALIIPPDIEKSARKLLRALFCKEERSIKFYDINAIEEGIKETVIIVLQYRYTDRRYPAYPNSFDRLPLKNGQRGLIIINLFTHNDLYSWNKWYYDKYFNELLFSEFRQRILRWKKHNHAKPSLISVDNMMAEEELASNYKGAERCIIEYENESRRYFAHQRALCKTDEAIITVRLKDLYGETGFEIQVLDEIGSKIRNTLLDKAQISTEAEKAIRSNEKYGLTEDEINNESIELWRYLLKQKITRLGAENVYKEIVNDESELSMHSFMQWVNFDKIMILPRSRKHQLRMLAYLGFEPRSPYHIVVLRKKMLSTNETRNINTQIESLLEDVLTTSIKTQEDFDNLLEDHQDILFLLEVNNITDLEMFISLLDISFKRVKSISHDTN